MHLAGQQIEHLIGYLEKERNNDEVADTKSGCMGKLGKEKVVTTGDAKTYWYWLPVFCILMVRKTWVAIRPQ